MSLKTASRAIPSAIALLATNGNRIGSGSPSGWPGPRAFEFIDDEPTTTKRLIVLTPDANEPDVVNELDDERIVWMSFDGLVSALEGVLSRDEAVSADETRPPTERETFLIRELVRFIYDTELTSGVEEAYERGDLDDSQREGLLDAV